MYHAPTVALLSFLHASLLLRVFWGCLLLQYFVLGVFGVFWSCFGRFSSASVSAGLGGGLAEVRGEARDHPELLLRVLLREREARAELLHGALQLPQLLRPAPRDKLPASAWVRRQ